VDEPKPAVSRTLLTPDGFKAPTSALTVMPSKRSDVEVPTPEVHSDDVGF